MENSADSTEVGLLVAFEIPAGDRIAFAAVAALADSRMAVAVVAQPVSMRT